MRATHSFVLTVAAALAALSSAPAAKPPAAPPHSAAAESPASPPMLTFHRPTIAFADQRGDLSRTMPVAVYLPPDYDPAKAYPLIVFLHGSGERGDDGLRAAAVGLGPAVVKNPERWPCIIAFPQIRARSERPEASVGGHPGDPGEQWMSLPWLPAAVAEWVMSNHKVDANRVYLTGLSNGGGGTWAAASETPSMWAAIAPVCGWNAIGRGKANAAALKDIPAWAFHGEKDDVIPPTHTQAMAEEVNAAGGAVKVTIFPGVNHGSWDPAYADPALPEWLFSKRRSGR